MNSSGANSGKSLPPASNYPPPAPPGQSAPSNDFSRRPAPASSGASTAQPMPRKGQGSRKQHRNQRRPSMGERRNKAAMDGDDAMEELRAVRNPSSRRGQTSITHLLNYTSPRPFQDNSYHPRPHRRQPTWGPGSGHHAVDKSRYVHANYRFVVSPEGTYCKQAADADLFLEWTGVMQVIASTESQGASCPICLSEPVAPRMAKCGHIFCLPCLIRFMNMYSSDDEAKCAKGARWKKCPICEDSVYLHEVRPVRFYAGQESALPRVGDDIVLRLMSRKADSTLALPRDGSAEVLNSGDDIPWHFAANVLDYARIMKGTREYMNGQFDAEIAALLKQEKEDETLFGQDGEWTQRAMKAVKAGKERVADMRGEDSAVSTTGRAATMQSIDADFYFYSTPPHLYLSPLDIRILKTKYGSFSSFPSTLLPRVEHISTGHVVDDAMRKRAKYLGHLPYGCVVSFIECDWTDIVPEEILSSFSSEISKRQKRNRDKAAQEERERVDAERVEAAALRSSSGMAIPSGPIEEDRPPVMDMSEFQPLNGAASTTPPDTRPGFAPLASMSTSPSTQRTVWGTVAIPGSPEMGVSQVGDADDGWLKDDEFLDTNDLSVQLDAIQQMENVTGPDASQTAAATGGGGGGKKKKKQKITLMSTGGRRGF